ncbi:5-keto-4-deoxy-D-glucarate aldolase [Baekduia alba]|uniref:HpcH/HpaI aldolase family protein n=1 Tax=Baekduia alba TaxID=2997333 RepID=UPI00234054DA|nr:aldolase/citrate lyase family protein [Baekduia alba]WCB94968.1 5-keto-4-deoxy-D-glucarate aldolase [Baekduia alba]
MTDIITNGSATKPLLGLILKMPAAATVELAGHAGFDLVVIDTEHGPSDMTELEHHCRAAECAGMQAWVRVSDGGSPDILRALDAGAHGIVVPHVTSAADVARAAALTRYPPHGRRSLALSTRAGRYGLRTTAEHLQVASRIALVAQIEDAPALAHVDEILAADGLSGIFIGPSDLSASLGHPGDPSHPDVAGAIDDVARAVLARPGCALCTLVGDEDEARAERDRGARIVLLNAPALLGGRLTAIVDALAPATHRRTTAP